MKTGVEISRETARGSKQKMGERREEEMGKEDTGRGEGVKEKRG